MFLSGMVGESKRFKITNTKTNLSFPKDAFPGEYIVVRNSGGGFYHGFPTITTVSGILIQAFSVSQSYFSDISLLAADPDQAVIFVMPAENVTIS